MLIGTRPFAGESVSETLAAVLKSDPDWSALNAPALQPVRTVLTACLEKDPRRRLRDIGDVRLAARPPPRHGPDRSPRATVAAPPPGVGRGSVSAVALGLWLAAGQQSATEIPLRRFELKLPAAAGGAATDAAISPDGSRVAYITAGRLWIHDLSTLEAREVAEVTQAFRPFWSSDSRWIAYGAPICRRSSVPRPAAPGARTDGSSS